MQFGHEAAGAGGVGGQGEVPTGGDDLLQAFDLPGGGGDIADGEAAGTVDGFVDGEEFGEEGIVVAGLFGAETRVVGREEALERFGEFGGGGGIAILCVGSSRRGTFLIADAALFSSLLECSWC
ncbi:MAG: hypothetical protein JNM66_18810 [Bryobacterales bacterium]|nr:hypothetical protein [Bryobacterales bacterium]